MSPRRAALPLALVALVLGCAGGPDKGSASDASATTGASSGGDASTGASTGASAGASTSASTGASASASTGASTSASTGAGSSGDASTGASASASATTSTSGPAACAAIVGVTECEALAAVSPDLTLDECLLCQGAACGSEPTCDSQYPCVDGAILLRGCCDDAECVDLTPFCGMYIGTNNVCVLSDDV